MTLAVGLNQVRPSGLQFISLIDTYLLGLVLALSLQV